MLFSVKEMWVHYEKVEAVKGVSLEADEGMLITLIGANGAGKTTILRTISGLKRLTSGEIWFRDKRIDGMAPHAIVKLGIAQVPEGKRLFRQMTVRDNLRAGAFLQKDRGEINRGIQEIFQHFPILKERQNQLAKTLSGGEQQMLAIGRALMAKPKVLLMDEPSLGLAPLVVVEIARIIKDIKAAGLTIILVEQNASLALKLADRGYVLETGRIVLEGESKELVKNEHVKKAYLGG